MQTRHQVDTSLRFDRKADLPGTRLLERTDVPTVPGSLSSQDYIEEVREPYLATSELEDAVNVAITLGRPLLLQGDPGAGKTRLAYALAYALGLPLEEAYVKSTTRAQDLLYTYDAVRRLYDAQFPPTGSDLPNARRPTDVSAYIRLGPLGRAIARGEFGRRSVVLIDEIDKADIDFPNDLLHELDQLAFDVTDEPGRRHTIPANRPDLRPIIIVTNNEEKTLPSAFLRRCIFHYLEFPTDPELLSRILDAHDPGHPEIRDKAVDVLLRLRELDLARRPGLSELLDWVSYLQAVQASPHDLDSLPHVGALLKQRGDQLRAEQLSPQQPNAGNGKTAPVSLP